MEVLILVGSLVGNGLLFFGAIPLYNNRDTIKEKITKNVGYWGNKINNDVNKLKDNYYTHRLQQEQEIQNDVEAHELLAPYDGAIKNIQREIELKEKENAMKEELMKLEERRRELDEQGKKISEAMAKAGTSLEEVTGGHIGHTEGSLLDKENGIAWFTDETSYFPIQKESEQEKRNRTGEKLKLLSEQCETSEDSLSQKGIILNMFDIEGLEKTVYGRYAYSVIVKTFKRSDLYVSNFMDSVHHHLMMEPDEVDIHINLKRLRAELIQKSGHEDRILRQTLEDSSDEEKILRTLDDILDRIDGTENLQSLSCTHPKLSEAEYNSICKFHSGRKAIISSFMIAIILKELTYHDVVSYGITESISNMASATNQEMQTVRDYIKVVSLREAFRRKNRNSNYINFHHTPYHPSIRPSSWREMLNTTNHFKGGE